MCVRELKREFTDYFGARGYKPTESAPLVISQLHTAFVMSVGLLQLKAVLTPHADERNFPPFCMVQRCIRHYDIERVGHANRLSFFEMAGAINSGDKDQAEVLSSVLAFLSSELDDDAHRLTFTVFSGGRYLGEDIPPDRTSRQALLKYGIPGDRIIPRGPEDNLFGMIAREESCGPSVEVFFDRGQNGHSGHGGQCQPGCDCERYVEVGTCVFLQYIKEADSLSRLPRTFSEAAIGMERLAFIRGGYATIYDLPGFAAVRQFISEHLVADTATQQDALHASTICADHLRAFTFAVAEGARPGRGGRAHLLRKLLRRVFARIDTQSKQIPHDLCSTARLIAERNSHVTTLTAPVVKMVCDVLADELALYRHGLDKGRIDAVRYLREDAS